MFGSPAPCADMPRNYNEARDFFERRRVKANTWRTLKASNTTVHPVPRPAMGAPAYAVKLYATDIIIYYPDGRVFLNAYQSQLTNSRREDAGVPTIHTARSMGVPKTDRLEFDVRWAIGNVTGPFRYGLPARDLLLDPDGQVEEIDGTPISQFVEHVLTPTKEAQYQRRAVINKARRMLVAWCRAQDAMGEPISEFNCDFEDYEELVKAAETGDEDELISQFIADHVMLKHAWLDHPQTTESALMRSLAEFQPGQAKGDKTLWRWTPVRPENLEEALK